MACTHPFGVDLIFDADGVPIGGRCPACGRSAFLVEEPFLMRLRRWIRRR